MICLISKWFISRARDTRHEIPARIRRHIEKCPGCRDFLLFSQSLAGRAAGDAQFFLEKTPESITERIRASLSRHPQPVRPRTSRRLLLPAAVSLGIALIVILVLVQPFTSRRTSSDAEESIPALLRNFASAGDSLASSRIKDLASGLESPYAAEWLQLSRTVQTISQDFKSWLDLKIRSTAQLP